MPNGLDEDQLAILQKDFTAEYRERMEAYRNARCLWCVASSGGYIFVSNPYWLPALGWTEGDLDHKSIFTLLRADELARVLDGVSQMQYQDLDQELIHLRRKDGTYCLFLCWLQRWQTKSSGVRVTYLTAIPVDE